MSRSNPQDTAVNPSTRWFEWNGESGVVRYYDKEAKRNVDVGDDFTFLLLDELGSVRGWHDASNSGIYSNEVKDTRADVLIVKSFKGGLVAEGIYRDIKDRVNAAGGSYNASCYIAYKGADSLLAIGNIRFKGAALGSWMEFRKAHRSELYESGIRIKGSTEGKKGRITFHTPNLSVVPLSGTSNAAAIQLDEKLQEFLASYLKKTTSAQVETTATHVSDEDLADDDDPRDGVGFASGMSDDDIPF